MKETLLQAIKDRKAKEQITKSFKSYCKYMFKAVHKKEFICAKHFDMIIDLLEKIVHDTSGKYSRVIINLPPRYGKTEIAIKLFVSWCLALYPDALFIHLSYSGNLALDNSSQTKEYVENEAFQKHFPMQLKKDAQAKGKWYNEAGGGMYAGASGGAVTGFGAGITGANRFSGAIIIDDPLKPDDASSSVKREAINERFNTTIKNRVNSLENAEVQVPIILIMQRLHESDLAGFLIDGGSGEDWFVLCLPALDSENNPLWPAKHSFETLEAMRQSDAYTFSGQYMQEPAPSEGGELKREWFKVIPEAEVPPNLTYEMFIDGAYTESTKNDPTGFLTAAKHNGNAYVKMAVDKYMTLPQMRSFIKPYRDSLNCNLGLTLVEPKASGKSIKQIFETDLKLLVAEIKTDFVKISKMERVKSSSIYAEGGRVYLVDGAWIEPFLKQLATFPNAKHDEFVDLFCYMVERYFINTKKIRRIRA